MDRVRAGSPCRRPSVAQPSEDRGRTGEAETRGTSGDHLLGGFDGADAAGGLDAEAVADGLAHEGDGVGARSSCRVEAGRGLDEVGSGRLGASADLDDLLIGQGRDSMITLTSASPLASTTPRMSASTAS